MNIRNIYAGKRVFVTGFSGFKGAWLCRMLLELGAEVYGYARGSKNPGFVHDLSDDLEGVFLGDVSDQENLNNALYSCNPDFIFHFAAQALVAQSVRDPVETFATNVIGSICVLEAIQTLESEPITVMITSDKCYENKEWIWGYRENDSLGGKDPYSASKASAELAISSLIRSKNFQERGIRVGVGRAGNVVGGGDSNLGRLFPDIITALKSDSELEVRNLKATRPWQHVLEPIFGYLTLGAQLFSGNCDTGDAFNFGPAGEPWTVEKILMRVNELAPRFKYSTNLKQSRVESTLLQLDTSKAQNILGWKSVLPTTMAVDMTLDWYIQHVNTPTQSKAKQLMDKQVTEYLNYWE